MFFNGQICYYKDNMEDDYCLVIKKADEFQYWCLFDDGEVFKIDRDYLFTARTPDNKVYFGPYCVYNFQKELKDAFLTKNAPSIIKEISNIKKINHERTIEV